MRLFIVGAAKAGSRLLLGMSGEWGGGVNGAETGLRLGTLGICRHVRWWTAVCQASVGPI